MLKNISDKIVDYTSREYFWLLVVFAVCTIVMLPMALTGIPEGYDIGQHLRQAAAFKEAVLDGVLVPGWADRDSWGYGSVSVRFYPPLADYLMGVIDIFVDNWYLSFLATAIILMFPGCFGMYFWAREYVSMPMAALAGSLFAVMPYHLLQIYQYTLFSEYGAAAVLPFCFWFVTRVINRGRAIDVLLFGASFSVLILMHLPSSIMGTMMLGVYALCLINWRKAKATILKLLVSGFLSVFATSFYWLRLVTELGWVNINNAPDKTSGFYSFVHYLFPIYFSSSEPVYLLRQMWMVDAIIVLTFLSLIFGIVCSVALKNRTDVEGRDKKFLFALAISSLFLIFIISIPSRPVWEYMPVLSKIQFPFRFLSIASVIASVSAVIAIPILVKKFPRFKRVVVYSASVVLASILVYDLTLNILTSAPYTPERFENLSGGMHQREGCDCFYPFWGDAKAFSEKRPVVAEPRGVEIKSWEREERRFTVDGGTGSDVRVATFWYPHWKAEVNGVAVEVGRDENGAILIPVGAERSEVRLYFREPFFLEAAKYVSLVTWIILMLAIIAVMIRKKESTIKLASVA